MARRFTRPESTGLTDPAIHPDAIGLLHQRVAQIAQLHDICAGLGIVLLTALWSTHVSCTSVSDHGNHRQSWTLPLWAAAVPIIFGNGSSSGRPSPNQCVSHTEVFVTDQATLARHRNRLGEQFRNDFVLQTFALMVHSLGRPIIQSTRTSRRYTDHDRWPG